MRVYRNLTSTSLAALALAVSMQAGSADRFETAQQPLASMAPLVLSNGDLTINDVKAYRPWFENGSWQGDLIEYSVENSGALGTSVSFGGKAPFNADVNPENWSALEVMSKEDPDTYWDTGRKIITSDGLSQVPFRWGEDAIGAANMALLDPTAVKNGDTTSNILDYIRGDQSNEYPADAAMRARNSILGDIIHSNPVYVGVPNGVSAGDGYAEWVAERLDRAPRVYVGANDGMLHVFDAEDGSEVYAYVPSMLMGTLSKIPARQYEHTYFVDGKLTVRDAKVGWKEFAKWRTVLIGTLGAGGKGLFALDITDPDLTSELDNSGDDKKLMWEVDASGDDDLGDSFSRAVIAQFNNGIWYAAVGNGYNSVNGKAILYIINLKTGGILRKISTNSGDSGNPNVNGLSSPNLLDSNGDGKVDYAYAGDIDGNVWKFDLTSDKSSEWDVAYSKPLFTGTGTQPITVAPQLAAHPLYGYMVFFATGKMLEADDILDMSVQGVYGIWDKETTPPNNPTLIEQPIEQKTYNFDVRDEDGQVVGTVNESIGIYNPAVDIDWSLHDGWKILFPAGYRVLEPIQVRASRVKATVYHPTGRLNWLLEASLFDGGPHPTPVFDINADRLLSNDDLYDDSAVDEDPDLHVPMIWRQPDGIMSAVTIARVDNGIDTQFRNYLNPPLVDEPCTGDCGDGFQGGHIDVDTYHGGNALGADSTKHDHEYDKKTGRVYVDYFDVNVPENVGADGPDRKSIDGHVEINTAGSGIDPDEPFIVLIANADFSPGSTMRIGNKTWNVVEYQRQIHLALQEWDATKIDWSTYDPDAVDPNHVPVDADGDSLVFQWGDIDAEGGTISHSFNDVSIINGGLHPTQTGCVKGDPYETYNKDTRVGRWRNGSLTTQLIKASHFSASSALTQVEIQLPEDLVEVVTVEDGSQVELSDDDGNPIGGLLAKSSTEHIYETTLFWHFGNLAKSVLGVKPCYGEDRWEEAAAFETSSDPVSAALAILFEQEGLGELEDLTLQDALEKYFPCRDKKKGGDGTCKDLYKLLEKLEDFAEDYGAGDGGDAGPDDGLDGCGEDGCSAGEDMGGGVLEGYDGGPKFNYGRMSWTDVVN